MGFALGLGRLKVTLAGKWERYRKKHFLMLLSDSLKILLFMADVEFMMVESLRNKLISMDCSSGFLEKN